MTIRAAVVTVLTCTSLFAVIGGGIGYGLGRFNPAYYRGAFRNGKEPGFDPVAVGLGQGLTQGIAGGAVVGLAVVALFVWKDSRLKRRDGTPPPPANTPAGQPPRRRRLLRWLLLAAAVVCVIPCGFFGFWMAAEAGSDSGSPNLAEEWRDEFAPFDDPSEAVAHDPGIILMRFRNGEWVFGRSQNSHGIWLRGGGTVVVKDSKGQTRAFFGHVCGGGHLGIGHPDLPNLEAFYKQLRESGFQEYHFR